MGPYCLALTNPFVGESDLQRVCACIVPWRQRRHVCNKMCLRAYDIKAID